MTGEVTLRGNVLPIGGLKEKSISAHRSGIKTVVIGDGDRIINQYPKENIKILSHDYVIICTNGEKIVMPNMTGWSRNLVNAYCNMIGNNCSINGNGYVVGQNILENSIIDKDIIVDLKDK